VRWLVIVALAVLLAVVSFSDVKDRRIPNWAVAAMTVLFVPWVFAEGMSSVPSSFEAAGITFAVSCGFYLFGMVGAGDSKLVTVLSFFVGLKQLLLFLVLVALAGGAIAVLSLVVQPVRAVVMFQMRGKGDFGRGIPYGVAISIAAMSVLTWRSAGFH
jgi:prepilin peptidase CpaA